jgi:hypothetical protein
MYPFSDYLLKAPEPLAARPTLEREYRRSRPEEGIGETSVRWREVAILEGLRAMMPSRRALRA